jgi:hypothetical protein
MNDGRKEGRKNGMREGSSEGRKNGSSEGRTDGIHHEGEKERAEVSEGVCGPAANVKNDG